MSWRDVLIWMTMMTSLLGLGHFYIYRRLVADPGLGKTQRTWAVVLLLGLLLLIPVTFATMRSVPRDWTTVPAFVAFGWMGLLSSWFTLLVLADIGRLLARGLERVRRRGHPPENAELVVSRRRALSRLLAGGVAIGGAGLTGVGVAIVAYGFTKKRLEVTLDKLPPAFDGFKIVQVSDVHVGPTIGRRFVESMVAAVNEEEADLVAITGDLVDGSVEQLREHTAPLAGLKARHGSYFVTGNHEYYSGADDWIEEVERLGIVALRNRRVTLEREGAHVDLAGVTDHHAGRFSDGPDFETALTGRDASRELLLLAHQPAALRDAQRHDVGLQLSGHTHGGQFWPWNWVVHLIQPVVAGLARFGRTQVYVNAGTGYWGPPVRLGTQSEVTVITLRAPRPVGSA